MAEFQTVRHEQDRGGMRTVTPATPGGVMDPLRLANADARDQRQRQVMQEMLDQALGKRSAMSASETSAD